MHQIVRIRAWISFIALVTCFLQAGACRHQRPPNDELPAAPEVIDETNSGQSQEATSTPAPPEEIFIGDFQGMALPDFEKLDQEQLLAAIIVNPPFDTGKWQIYLGSGRCRPAAACTIMEARMDGKAPVRLKTAEQTAGMFPPNNAQEAANMAGFFLRHSHAFRDIGCTDPPTDNGLYSIDGLKPPQSVRPVTLRMDGERWAIRIVEACWGNPDRLVHAEEIFGADGFYQRTELEVLGEAFFLPRITE